MTPDEVLARLDRLRALDAPTHGGRLLSYVYDAGRPELDEVAASAIRAMQPVNGLDPTTFRSVGVIEREVVRFARDVFHGGDDVTGTATSGGTESCLLAVKTARDAWRARQAGGVAGAGGGAGSSDGGGARGEAGSEGGAGSVRMPRLVAPVTVHAAFRKAAALFDLALDLVPVDAQTGQVDPAVLIARLGADVALVVVSAPSYPCAAEDPVAQVAAAAQAAGVDVHVDACIGGFALAFWPEDAAGAARSPWDFAVPGVTSLSADLHKYGYAPKGVSVLLQRGRDRQRHQWFATSSWPGYPVVNPTLQGSKSAGPLAAAWAIVQVLGPSGFRELTSRIAAAAAGVAEGVAAIEGLRVVGRPTGPMVAVAADETDPARRVDPHLWADAMGRHGFTVQCQPACPQSDGTVIPSSAHMTITPVTADVLPALLQAARDAADDVRGAAHLDGSALVAQVLGDVSLDGIPDADTSVQILTAAGLLGGEGLGPMAPVMALVETLPDVVVERLLVELLAAGIEQ